ncbi:MAG: cob(I)yrinic acid a,c-diamide adenosyltransferase [Phycisphaerales bacterium]|nr:MAG: cob(I)yrinic acid a,c-diamide adenosyltransferase [Phycisphaerales bacterium]
MVRLTRIYTRTGDQGQTGLGDGSRVDKFDLRVEAYGTTDEANAALGVAVAACRASDEPARGLVGILEGLQHDLFDCGADLCTPIAKDEPDGQRLRIVASQVERLEALIDRYNANLPTLESFVLPGGTPQAASLHVARTVVRRAERLASELLRREPSQTNPQVVRYLNRLSDLLFVLARVANPQGDVLWKPGANRSGDGPA